MSSEATRTPALAGHPESHFAAIVASSDDAILSKDGDGLITSWNAAAERIYGYTAEEAIGRHISLLIPEHRRGEEVQILDAVFSGNLVEHYETERVTKDGRIVIVSLSVSPVRDESGAIVRASVIGRDITDRERSRELAERLQTITSRLSREILRERTVEVLIEEVLAAVGADGGAVGLLHPVEDTITLVGESGLPEAEVSRFTSFPLSADNPMAESVRTGEALFSESAAELRHRFAGLAETNLTFASLAMVPLKLGDKPFGALSLSFRQPRHFDDEERLFLSGAARQAANALERARLYEAQRSLTERVSFLAEATATLSETLDPQETVRRVADLAVGPLADWCWVELLNEDGTLQNVAITHIEPEKVKRARELRDSKGIELAVTRGGSAAIKSGTPAIYGDVDEDLLEQFVNNGEERQVIEELGMRSAMIVPMVARGRALGAISFISSRSERQYETADLELAQELARRAALAIDNSMLFRRERSAALELQRSLLPQSLPEVEGLEFAAHYDPAGEDVEVGGDLYEVGVVDDGTVSVTIGDVAGRGIRAAAVMGRVRMALRAYVIDGHPPAEVMRRVDRVLRESRPREMVTMFHLRLSPASGKVSYVRAGHPPALIRLSSGEIRALDGDGTPPLGILDGVDYEAHEIDLPPGSLLLLYTDGLIERRGEDLDTSLTRLQELFRQAPEDASECLVYLRSALRADEVHDDVAMLAVARSAST